MDRTWSFMTLVVGLPLGLAGCDTGTPSVPPPPTGQQAATGGANPLAASLQAGGGTQSGPSAGPEGGATQAGVGGGDAVGSGAGPAIAVPGAAP